MCHLLMLLFLLPIKGATVYSIGTIFFSQFGKTATIAVTSGFTEYDLKMLCFIITAATLGSYLGTKLRHLLSQERVASVFRSVILLKLFNLRQLLF